MHSLFWNDAAFSAFCSCRIYCDACGDEQSGFLPPLARIARWHRLADVRDQSSAWPSVSIELWSLSPDCPQLHAEVKRQQRLVDRPVLEKFGLPVRRDFGDGGTSSSGQLCIETEAGWQSLSRRFWLKDLIGYADALDRLVAIIRSRGRLSSTAAWTERYGRSPMTASHHWDWNYRAISEPEG